MKRDDLVDAVAREMTSLDRAPDLGARVMARLPETPRRDWRWIAGPIGLTGVVALAVWIPRDWRPQDETETSPSVRAEIVTPAVQATDDTADLMETPTETAAAAQKEERLAPTRATTPAAGRLSASAAPSKALDDEVEFPDHIAPLPIPLPFLTSPEPLVVAVEPAEALAMPTLAIEPIPTSELVIPPLEIAALPGAGVPDGAL